MAGRIRLAAQASSPDVLLVGVLVVDAAVRHQAAVGAEHKAAQLGKDSHVSHARRHQELLILLPHTIADGQNVVGGLLGAVGDAHAAGEVDEGDVAAGLLSELHRRS